MIRNGKTFWSSDWFSGVLFTIAFLLVTYGLARSFFYGLETSVYDRALGWKNLAAGDQIAVVAIDEQSIESIGRWPWSRDVLAAAIDTLNMGGAKVIANAILLSEPQVDPGSDYLKDIERFVADPAFAASAHDAEPAADLDALRAKIRAAINNIDYDARLATSLGATGNVILPLHFASIGAPLGNPDRQAPAFVTRNRIAKPGQAHGALPFGGLTAPIPALGVKAEALGHLNQILDVDGAVRFEALVVDYYGELYPSLALATAARAMNLDSRAIEVLPGQGLRLGRQLIETTPRYEMYNHFYTARPGQSAFSVHSFYDVFSGQVPPEKFRDRVVLIGASAAGVGDNLTTPASKATPPVMVLAHTVASIINGHYVTRPAWAVNAEMAVLAVLALYIVIVLPRLRAGLGALVSLALALALFGVQVQMLMDRAMWLHLMVPLTFLLSGHLVVTIKRFGVTERLKARSDEAGAESNRMLGLAFQGQGQLDMALEKFRQCPLDDSLMEPLYNLALDFERKRQFNKAGAVYNLIADHDASYRDLPTRRRRSQALDETLILGGANQGSYTNLVLDDGVQKPMLGRYQVEKEIGKGAMGTVYLGRDPKINRVVAIKTIALGQEFDEDEVESVRERFFREAETAGRLNHPDIVTVYDAGEEHDLAYIAMEFLKGEHLSQNTRANRLLPVDTVIAMMTRAADALAYAHTEDVVHRDIKPANIMYHPASGDLKITDFGIARITSSSKTKTGIVLGTPSYMSPEQLAGKNVTGRSDLFSLGVTLYQLLAGQLPFRADSMATLMYKIANEPHTPLRAARPELPACLENVVDRALHKDLDERYHSGAEMAIDLRDCVAHLAA